MFVNKKSNIKKVQYNTECIVFVVFVLKSISLKIHNSQKQNEVLNLNRNYSEILKLLFFFCCWLCLVDYRLTMVNFLLLNFIAFQCSWLFTRSSLLNWYFSYANYDSK